MAVAVSFTHLIGSNITVVDNPLCDLCAFIFHPFSRKVPARPRHTSSGYSLASHRGGPGSRPGLVKKGFVVNKVALGQIFSKYFCFHQPIFIPPNSPSS
jgi:hypothetical protein